MNISRLNAKGKDDYESRVQEIYSYYNKHVSNNKRRTDALNDYKGYRYESINGLLYKQLKVKTYGFMEQLNGIINEKKMANTASNSSNEITVDDILSHEKVADTIKRSISIIKTLDDIIAKAPKLKLTNDTVLYRGMNHDIEQDITCGTGKDGQKGVYYYTPSSYMSTSFSPTVSMRFTSPKKCGVFFTIIKSSSTKDVQGMFVNWKMRKSKEFENAEIDSEYEFILPRLTKFKVEKIDFIPYHEAYPEYKYRDIACKKQLPPSHIKHYTLSIVSQPSLAQLSKTYKSLKDDVQITIEPLDLSEVSLKEHLKTVASQRQKQQSKNTKKVLINNSK